MRISLSWTAIPIRNSAIIAPARSAAGRDDVPRGTTLRALLYPTRRPTQACISLFHVEQQRKASGFRPQASGTATANGRRQTTERKTANDRTANGERPNGRRRTTERKTANDRTENGERPNGRRRTTERQTANDRTEGLTLQVRKRDEQPICAGHEPDNPFAPRMLLGAMFASDPACRRVSEHTGRGEHAHFRLQRP